MITVNEEQGLYIIPAGKGFSCLGFQVAFERASKLAAEIGRPALAPSPANVGKPAGYNEYEAVLAAASAHHAANGTRSAVDLTPQLVGREGKRVEVVDRHCETRRFIVGRSTGWMPCHLEIARRTSHGGGAVTGAPFKSIRVVG